MSRCKACDVILTPFELTRKYSDGTFVDLCSRCFKSSGYRGVVMERADLRREEDDSVVYELEDYFDD